MGEKGTAAALEEKLNNIIFSKYEDNDKNQSLISTVAEIFTISYEHVPSRNYHK